MRQFIRILLAAGALLSASCAKPLPVPDPDAPTGEGDLIEVTFLSDEGPGTRATAISDDEERAVGRWAVFAFDDESGWYAYATSASGSPVKINLRAARSYTCYAMVNYPTSGPGAFNPSSVRHPSDLTGKDAYLSDNAVGALLMFGSLPFTAEAVSYDPASGTAVPSATKTIRVSRLVSRIDVRGIGVDFSDKPALSGKTFTLRHIYVTNTYRTSRYGSDYRAGDLSSSRIAWYNTMGWHRGETELAGMDALLGDRGLNVVLSSEGSAYSTAHSFYAFPNASPRTADTHDLTQWRQRSTRIVIEATLDSDTVYYQVSLPAMERNHIYAASDIVIRGRGSNDPEALDYDPDVVSVTFTLSEDGWDGTASVSENS